MKTVPVLTIAWAILIGSEVPQEEPDPRARVKDVVSAVGGEAKLLKRFRMKERLNVSPDPTKKGSERVSVLEPPKAWWVGETERVRDEKEPAVFLVWAWTLGALTNPNSTVQVIPEIAESGGKAFGLRVSGTIEPPMDLYFDRTEKRLVRIDWRSDIHRFSDWKEHDGVSFPSKCVGFKKATGKAWYHTEILELERVDAVPEGSRRR